MPVGDRVSFLNGKAAQEEETAVSQMSLRSLRSLGDHKLGRRIGLERVDERLRIVAIKCFADSNDVILGESLGNRSSAIIMLTPFPSHGGGNVRKEMHVVGDDLKGDRSLLRGRWCCGWFNVASAAA